MTHRKGTGAAFLLLLGLFTTSGAVGLLYEVAWVRRLSLIFGNTTWAASATLAIFFLGLAVGAALAGRLGPRVGRPLRLYGILELCLGAYAALTPWAFDAALPVYRLVYRAAPDNGALLLFVQGLLCLAILLPPTAIMGATLPVLSAALAREGRLLSARIGRLYGWNTVGAAAGAWVTGFVLLGWLGVMHTIWLGAVGSGLVGLGALLLARGSEGGEATPSLTEAEPAEAADPRPPVSAAAPALVIGVMAVSGALSLAYEVTWTRLVVYIFGTTAYAFAVMLVTYLFGLGLGGVLGARWLRRRRATPAHLAWTQLAIGAATALSVWALLQLPAINRAANESPMVNTAWGFYTFRFLQSVGVMFLPTLAIGATFPLAVDLLAPRRGRASPVVGRLYAWNTAGGVAGSLLAGFVAIPLVGTLQLLRLGIAGNAALAVALIGPRALLRRVPALAATGVTAALALALGGVSFTGLYTAAEFGSIIRYQREGAGGTVTIHEYPETGVKVLNINGTNVAGTTLPLLTTQKLQGHIPALLHGHPKSAMQIGFGSGETAKVLALHGLETIHGVEISPEVIAAGAFWAELNQDVAYSKRFEPIIMDAVSYVRLTDRKYDLVLNDSVFPGLAGSSALYTRDHFAACATRLNPGGIFSCWLPLDVPRAHFRMILASLTDVFPYTQFWLAANCDNKNGLLVASREPLRIDLPAWAAETARPAVAADLASIDLGNAADLASYLLLDSDGMRAIADHAPLNTHDHPRLEYGGYTPKSYDRRWAENLALLLVHRPDMDAVLTPRSRRAPALLAELRRVRPAHYAYLAGVEQALGNHGLEARRLYTRALSFDPTHHGALYSLARMKDGVARAEHEAALHPDDPAALGQLARAYWRAGRPADALGTLASLRERTALTPEQEELLVVCAIAARRPEAAAPVIGRVVARHPDDPTWGFNAGMLAELAGDDAGAAERYEALLAKAPDHWPARAALARLRMRQGRFAEGEAILEAAPDAQDDARWHHLMALAYAGQGRTADARAAAARARQLNPEWAEAQALEQMLRAGS